MKRFRILRAPLVCVAALLAATSAPFADTAPQPLPFSQDWTNTALITTANDWSNVPGIVGYMGGSLASSTATEPRNVLAPDAAAPQVFANQTSTGFTSGGVAEFHLANPVVALQGSATADAPHILISVNTTGWFDVNVAYNLRDLDGSADNTTSRIALQYRVGSAGNFINVPDAYVADASEGPSIAGKVTPVSAVLPADASNAPLVQIRIITTDAPGSDEWIGIDDISITGSNNAQPTSPSGVGQASPRTIATGDQSLLTVAVTPGENPASSGLSVVADLAPIGGSATQALTDDGQNGDAVAGDLVFSWMATVSGAPGVKSVTATINDDFGRGAQATIALTITAPPMPIHALQGAGTSSTYEGLLVTTSGIVTATRPSSFYIQTPDHLADADPNTSEGLIVYTGSTPAVNRGDLVKVTGTLTEYRPSADPQSPPVTEITSPTVSVTATGQPLPAPVVLLPEHTPSDSTADQLERFEGMRVRADITAISGTDGSKSEANARSTSNGEFAAVITGVARPMREPGLEPGQLNHSGKCCAPRFDGNPERLRVDSDAQSGAARIEIVAGQTLAGLTGVLDYGFRSYTILPDAGAWVPAGRGDALPVPAPTQNEFTIASFNMERFYDTVNDPGGDVALTADAYGRRLAKASLTIRNVLRTPDIIGVEEVEKLSVLQAIAARVNADAVAAGDADPAYVAYLAEGNDSGGIDVGFLVKSSRLDVIAVTQVGKEAMYLPPGSSTSALLNDRPPLVLEAAVRADGATPYPVTVIVNHLRSLIDIDGADGRVAAKRAAQAEFLASLIQSRQAANPNERIIAVGDFNAFQFNDGYADLIGTITGQPTPADQVAVASADLVSPDLVNLGNTLGADQYSYVFGGNAQAIDHVLANEDAHRRFSRIVYARANADFPESLRGDGTRPERLTDHDIPVAYFTLPGAPVVTLSGAQTMTLEAMTSFTDPGASATDEEFGSVPVTVTGSVDATTLGTYTLTYSATNGFLTTSVTRTVNVVDTTAPVLTLTGGATAIVEAGATWIDPGATATDARAGDLTSAIQVSGSVNTAAVGSYILTYTVTDGFNTATATRTVSVVDTTAPAIGPIALTPSVIDVPNHKMVDVTLAYSVTDVIGAACSVNVTSNEPIDGPGDGHTLVDYQVLNVKKVRVRAERSGLGTGRIYTIAVTCADGSGNQSTAAATVTVR